VSTVPVTQQELRRSSRLNQAIALTVQGADASRAPYLEHVSTLTVNCHGCKYRSKNRVLLGDLVLFALENDNHGPASPRRARVRHVLQLATDELPFEVGLELEAPGNIWAIPSPPEDWFAVREAVLSETAASGLRVLPRNDASIAPTLVSVAPASVAPVPVAPASVERTDAGGSPSPFLSQFMVGLSEQIRSIAAEAATAAVMKEKGQLLEEFRAQLREEARKTLEHTIVVARENAGSRVLKELNAAHQAAARTTYEHWVKKLEQDFAETAQRSVSLGGKVNERVEKAALSTAERVQQNLDASRREAVDQFRARLRTEVTPLLEEAQAAIQKLAAFQEEVKVRSLEICGQFSDFLKEEGLKCSAEAQQRVSECEGQIGNAVKEGLAKASEEMETRSTQAAGAFADNLRKLSQECEQAAQDRLKSLAESNAELAANLVKERIAELSSQFSSEMESYRNYLELVSASIGEIAKKQAVRAQP